MKMHMMKEKELLQDLTQMTGCSFISDLKFLPEPDLIKIVLKIFNNKDRRKYNASYRNVCRR